MQELPHFDFLMRLAKNNPEKLDQLQAELNQALIKESQNPELLNRVWSDYQKRMDLCHTPMERCLTASELMQQKLKTMAQTLNGIPESELSQANNCIKFPASKS